ncbi:PBECR4 domain-containing protein, partial [Streptococcus gallolyticus]|uniref:PBECR4 domain-containing protein n=2 Tax=Streptococcus gallolyticus TaxID=315405 RepID=UPI000777219C
TDFNQSVNFLNDGEFKTFQRVERSEEPFNYYLHPYEQPFNEARTYLREERGLSDDTIDFFLEKGVLVQANAKLNDSIEPVVVFKTLSPSGEVVGANLQGIEENFEKWPERGYAKIIARNSDGMNGLHVDIGQPKRLVFAESPIDLMSYYELHKDNLQDVRLVSMDGLKESTIGRHLAELQAERSGRELRWSKEELANGLTTAVDNNYFTEGKHADVITLAVDNDEAGRNFITSLQDKGVSLTVDIPDLPEGQEKADWNSYLQQKKQSTPETEAITSERLPLSNIQDHLSTEADLVSTIASDGSMLYTNTVNFDQAYSLNLEVHSPEEVDNLSDVKAPWSLEVTKDNQSLGFLAYGEDWGNDFNIEDELVNLDSWVTRNQVENHLYSQEEVNSFLKPLTAEKEAVGELKSYGTFIINDDFLERRYGSVEHDNSIRTAIEQLSNLIGFNNMPINDQETEWVHTKEVDFEGTQLILDVYSSSEDKIFEGKNQKNNWSIAVLGANGPLGFLTYGEAWLDDINDGTTLRDKLADLQTWIIEGSISKHLYTQQDYNQFLDSLKENAQRTSISYEDYKQETKNFEESVKQKIASGDLSINVDDDVYAYLVFNGLGHSYPLKTVTDERLVALHSSDIPEQLRAITEENVDAYKTKGTVEQDRLYQSLKTNQKDLGLAEVSTRLVGEMAISAYNANLRLAGLSQKGYQASYLSLFSNAIRTVIEYPYMENVGTGDYIVNHVDYALYHHLDDLSGNVTLTQKDLTDIIETASYHTPKIINVENKKSLENLQETVASNSEQQKNERTYQRKGSLQPEAEGSTSPVPEIGTFERSVTSRPTVSSQYLKFTIKNGFKSRKIRVEQSIDAYNLGKLNRRGHDLQEAAQFYLNELANSTIHYFTADNSLVQVNFFENNFMHLTGLKIIGESETPEKVLHDLARGGELSYDDIRIKNTESPFDKLKVLPDLETILQTDSFYFDHLQDIPRYQDRFDSLIKSDDSDLMVLFRMTSEDGTVPVSIFKARQTLSNELQEARKNEIIGIYRERDGQVEQIAINDEYVKDNGEEMFSILQNKEYQEVSNEQVEMPEPDQPDVTAEDFTKVLDAVYNNGAQIGKDNRDNIPEALHPAWDKYDEYAAQHDNDFNQIMDAAEKDHLLYKSSDFYKAWSQDDIYDNHYHVRLQNLSDETSLPFQATDFIDYQDFARELYRQNQHSQSGDEVTSATVNFAIYAPGGDLIKEGISYHIGEENKLISQLLGLGYRRLTGYQELAKMDEVVFSQLENQTLNQTIAEDIAEGVPTSRETRQEVTASHNEAKTITSEREVLKNRFQRRVEEILNESPVQNQVNHRTGDIIINNSTVASNNSMIINSGIMSNRQTDTSTIHKTPSSPSPKKPSEPVDYQKVSAYELSQAAFQKIREYTQSPKDLAEYLDFMSKFPTLSPRNVALIQAQWPGANAVATYNQWQAMGDSLGLSKDDVMQTKATYTNKRTGQTKEVVHNSLSVKAGEKSRIRLFRPQMEKMIPVLDNNGNQLKNEKGNPKFKRLSQATPQEKALVKEKKLKVSLFQKRDANGQPLYTTYNVFELSQTTLKPESYPKVMPNRHYNFDMDQVKSKEVLEGLCDYAKSLGVSILSDDAHTLGNIKGAFDPNRQEILLNPHNTPGEKIGTSIHELAHATLHNPKLTTSQTKTVPRYQAELEAEMTSYLVSKHFGLDTGDKAFRYMAKWTDNLNVYSDKALTDSMTRIHKTVMSMVKHVEHHTKPYQRNHGQQPNFPKAQDKGLSR